MTSVWPKSQCRTLLLGERVVQNDCSGTFPDSSRSDQILISTPIQSEIEYFWVWITVMGKSHCGQFRLPLHFHKSMHETWVALDNTMLAFAVVLLVNICRLLLGRASKDGIMAVWILPRNLQNSWDPPDHLLRLILFFGLQSWIHLLRQELWILLSSEEKTEGRITSLGYQGEVRTRAAPEIWDLSDVLQFREGLTCLPGVG